MAKKIKLAVKAMASNDDTVVVWHYTEFIKDCWGFALFRKRKGESDAIAEPVPTSVGFESEPHQEGEKRPSTEWPLQRFMWTDYYVRQGDEVCYKVVPMINVGDKLVKEDSRASNWSNWVKVHNGDQEVYYNRGLVASQFIADHMLKVKTAATPNPKLDDELEVPSSSIRKFMGGTLVERLYKLLDDVKNDSTITLYAALYELNDTELIRRLNLIGKRANVILANGAFGKDDLDPQAPNAKVLTKVRLTRRIVSSGHFAHNKFVVLTRKTNSVEKPFLVFTGSTNWTLNGLFKQANNAVVFNDDSIASYYFDEWKQILVDCKNDKGLYDKPFKTFNATVKVNKTQTVRTWFTPTAAFGDMIDARKLLNAAKEGILFLMFKPGNAGNETLYDEIISVSKKKKQLLVHGVINTDPGGKANPTIEFMNKGKIDKGSFQGVTKANIKNSFSFWQAELASPNVTIHSKLIVIDPFSANPVVLTGSHNMGKKASKSNDDNLNILTNDPDLAVAYAVHIMSVYHHYRWRYYRSNAGVKKWSGNIKDDKWQNWYWLAAKTGNNRKELEFWWHE
jgi:phosphatidylserine/phosphatidylglycerophosphate/cardiolipin synthase-like enzyme